MDYADGKLLARHRETREEHLFFLDNRGLLFGASPECDLISKSPEIEPQHVRILPLGDVIWLRTQKNDEGKIDETDLGTIESDDQVAGFSLNIGEYTFERCYRE